jgi:hypothetical protein
MTYLTLHTKAGVIGSLAHYAAIPRLVRLLARRAGLAAPVLGIHHIWFLTLLACALGGVLMPDTINALGVVLVGDLPRST